MRYWAAVIFVALILVRCLPGATPDPKKQKKAPALSPLDQYLKSAAAGFPPRSPSAARRHLVAHRRALTTSPEICAPTVSTTS